MGKFEKESCMIEALPVTKLRGLHLVLSCAGQRYSLHAAMPAKLMKSSVRC